MESGGPTYMALTIFAVSFIPSLSPYALLSSKRLKNMYDKASIVSAGLLLAILFIDFMPHLVEGGCGHSHGHEHSHAISNVPVKPQASGHSTAHGAESGAATLNNAVHSHSHEHGHSHKHNHSHKHTDQTEHSHSHEHGSAQSRIGLILAGLTLVGLIIIDQKVIKHSHCDNEKGIEKIKADGSTTHEHSHGHGHSHGHSHSHEHSHAIEVNRFVDEDSHASKPASKKSSEIKGCCTEGLKYKTTIKQALIFIFIFSIHSIFEGFAFTSGQAGQSTLFLGLAVHKVLESVTVGVALFSSQFKKPVVIGLLLVYSSLTPIGMLSAYFISDIFDSGLIKSIFTGISFGSLSFIVLVEMLPPIVHSLTNGMKIFYLLCGYLVGAGLICLAHSH
ncbi:solute carrier family 39 (zinc transporter), member 1/2/3 [Nematocida sp. AWRm78]|nr:solute carrier family 39 (zinc transporter), member 1/2/3 [Nematocida sp. AWRm79]KAI5186403.1 solute carrier family 39 (zinc transporter), member 1/2/3 [Nematocida sp. AWRm78]